MEFSVDRRIPFTLPVLSSDRICSVIPINSANSFDLTLRLAGSILGIVFAGIIRPGCEMDVSGRAGDLPARVRVDGG